MSKKILNTKINIEKKKNIIITKFFNNLKPLDILIIEPFLLYSENLKNFLNFKSNENYITFLFCIIIYLYFFYHEKEYNKIVLYLLFLSYICDKIYYKKIYKKIPDKELISEYDNLITRLLIFNLLFLIYFYYNNKFTEDIIYIVILLQIILFVISYHIYKILENKKNINNLIILTLLSILSIVINILK